MEFRIGLLVLTSFVLSGVVGEGALQLSPFLTHHQDAPAHLFLNSYQTQLLALNPPMVQIALPPASIINCNGTSWTLVSGCTGLVFFHDTAAPLITTDVSCPSNSNGASVASGCSRQCNAGYSGPESSPEPGNECRPILQRGVRGCGLSRQ